MQKHFSLVSALHPSQVHHVIPLTSRPSVISSSFPRYAVKFVIHCIDKYDFGLCILNFGSYHAKKIDLYV